ncbi:uncharacterized protein BDW43DRAFT_285549 [Aspergillus alliaceus]|uniref:uncharacterized protein n=1 Tax=Petromyces alliaceus TaxID=209559 RepID=UPI0012A40AB6|nr:uncharacterized protein BDW43DRAFT_285549 [Aspergillus alliaceus]KAB8230492.1 hypothetical protein BDW43DRAFT_285549 [Aspergillus alliaceus]
MLAGIHIWGDGVILMLIYSLLTLLKLYGMCVLAVLADYTANFQADELEKWLETARAQREGGFAHSGLPDSDLTDIISATYSTKIMMLVWSMDGSLQGVILRVVVSEAVGEMFG